MDLQTLMHQRMGELGITSYGQLARAAHLPTSTITRLFREAAKDLPRADTLEALATGLQLPVSIVRRAAGESVGLVQPDEPLEEDITQVVAMMRQASPPDRLEIREVVETILRAAQRRRGAEGEQATGG